MSCLLEYSTIIPKMTNLKIIVSERSFYMVNCHCYLGQTGDFLTKYFTYRDVGNLKELLRFHIDSFTTLSPEQVFFKKKITFVL